MPVPERRDPQVHELGGSHQLEDGERGGGEQSVVHGENLRRPATDVDPFPDQAPEDTGPPPPSMTQNRLPSGSCMIT